MNKQPYERHGLCSKNPCGKCIYRSIIGMHYSCDYIGYTGTMRPCPAGKGCTAFKEGAPLSQKRSSTAVKTKVKECKACGKRYVGTQNQRYCTECYTRKQAERNRQASAKKLEKQQQERLQVVRICKACSAEYRSQSNKVLYCESCKTMDRKKLHRMMERGVWANTNN